MPDLSHNLMDYLRTLAGTWHDDPRDDAELLTRFVGGDETAYKTIIWRHGPLVWRTCKRVLKNEQDAEDVFQTTFIALARKASRLQRLPLAGWLFQVARRAALDAVIKNRRREKREHSPRIAMQSEEKDVNKSALYAGLDEELVNLPEKLRVPLLLHYLEGKSQVEVAKILGCARNALQKRLAKGEAVLRKRLEQRGLSLDAVSLAVLLGDTSGVPAVPCRLVESTARAAVAFKAGMLANGSAQAAERVLRVLTVKGAMRVGWLFVIVCSCTLGLGGFGLAIWKICREGTGAAILTAYESEETKIVESKKVNGLDTKKLDLYGDPLPTGAIARIGTVRLRGVGTLNVKNCDLRFKTALSPDGKTLVSADKTEIIHFWDVGTGKELRKVPLNFTGGKDVWVKNAQGKKVKTREVKEISLECAGVVFSPNDNLLAVKFGKVLGLDHGDYEKDEGVKLNCNSFVLLDSVTGQFVSKTLRGIEPVFSPDGKTLVCVSDDMEHGTTCTLYDISTRKVRSVLKLKNRDILSSVLSLLSNDSRMMAFVDSGGVVHLLDIKTGNEIRSLQAERKIVAMAFTSDNNVVTADEGKDIRVWNAKAGKEIRSLGKMNQVPTLVSLFPDGKTVVSACAGQVRFWEISTGKETRPTLICNDLVNPIILSADGKKLIERAENAVSVWDVSTGKEIGPTAGASRSLMRSLAFSPDGAILATTTDEEYVAQYDSGIDTWHRVQQPGMAVIRFWEVATGKSFGAIRSKDSFRGLGGNLVWPTHDTILSKGDYGITGLVTRGIFRWTNVDPKNETSKVEIYKDGHAFSSDGQILACRRTQLELLDVANGKKISVVPNRTRFNVDDGIQYWDNLVFSADHEYFATQAEADNPVIELRETSTGRKLYSLNLPAPNPSQRILFSPDGRLLAIVNDQAADLREIISGKQRLRISIPTADCRIGRVAFSPDNRLLAVGCLAESTGKKSIYIWDLATGKVCQQFHGHRADRNGFPPEVAFSPDGRCLASSGGDYTVLIWNVKRPLIPERASKPLDPQELQALKTALEESDAAVAGQAIWKLRQLPEQAVPLMAECLRPRTLTSAARQTVQEVNRLIESLDSNDFQMRTSAADKLSEKLMAEKGEPVIENALRLVLAGNPPVEVSKALTRLLVDLNKERQKNEKNGWGGSESTELIRMVRAIEVLEQINNGSAHELLTQLVQSPPRPEIRREAEAALRRLTKSRSASIR